MREYSKCSLYRNFKTDWLWKKYILALKEPYNILYRDKTGMSNEIYATYN